MLTPEQLARLQQITGTPSGASPSFNQVADAKDKELRDRQMKLASQGLYGASDRTTQQSNATSLIPSAPPSSGLFANGLSPQDMPKPQVASSTPTAITPSAEKAPAIPQNQPAPETTPPALSRKDRIKARLRPEGSSTPKDVVTPAETAPTPAPAPDAAQPTGLRDYEGTINASLEGQEAALAAQKEGVAKQFDPQTQIDLGQAGINQGIFQGNAALQSTIFGKDTKAQSDSIGQQFAGAREAIKSRIVQGQGEVEQAKLAQEGAGLAAKASKDLQQADLTNSNILKGKLELDNSMRDQKLDNSPLSSDFVKMITKAGGPDLTGQTMAAAKNGGWDKVVTAYANGKSGLANQLALQLNSQKFQETENQKQRDAASVMKDKEIAQNFAVKQNEQNKEFYNDATVKNWNRGGKEKVTSGINRLEDLSKSVKNSSTIGNIVDRGANAVGMTTPDVAEKRQEILGIIVPILKESFGGNPSDGERKAIGEMLYDPKASKEANARAIQNYIADLKAKSDAMDSYIARGPGAQHQQPASEATPKKYSWEH